MSMQEWISAKLKWSYLNDPRPMALLDLDTYEFMKDAPILNTTLVFVRRDPGFILMPLYTNTNLPDTPVFSVRCFDSDAKKVIGNRPMGLLKRFLGKDYYIAISRDDFDGDPEVIEKYVRDTAREVEKISDEPVRVFPYQDIPPEVIHEELHNLLKRALVKI